MARLGRLDEVAEGWVPNSATGGKDGSTTGRFKDDEPNGSGFCRMAAAPPEVEESSVGGLSVSLAAVVGVAVVAVVVVVVVAVGPGSRESPRSALFFPCSNTEASEPFLATTSSGRTAGTSSVGEGSTGSKYWRRTTRP